MKVIDNTALGKANDRTGKFDRLLDNVRSSLSRGESEAQDVFIAALGKWLDNRFVLIKDVALEKLEVTIPLLLVGPTGLWAIYPSNSKGIYRITENTWEELDNRRQNYKPVKPNIIVRAGLMARATEDHLSLKGFLDLPPVEPVLFFSDPGVHIESSQPAARIVLGDALDRFVTSIVKGQADLDSTTVQRILKELVGDGDKLATEVIRAEKRDAWSFQEESPPRRPRSSVLNKLPQDEPDLVKRIPFNRKQLMILGFLLIVSISMVIFLIFFILMTI